MLRALGQDPAWQLVCFAPQPVMGECRLHSQEGCSCKSSLGEGRKQGWARWGGRSEHPKPHPASTTTWGRSLGPREWEEASGSHCWSLALQPQTRCTVPARWCWPGLVAPEHCHKPPTVRGDTSRGLAWAKGLFAGGNAGAAGVVLQILDLQQREEGSCRPEVLRVSGVGKPCTPRRGVAEWAWRVKKYRWWSLLGIALSDAFAFSTADPASPGSALGTGWSPLHAGRGAGCRRASGKGWSRAEAAHFS